MKEEKMVIMVEFFTFSSFLSVLHFRSISFIISLIYITSHYHIVIS